MNNKGLRTLKTCMVSSLPLNLDEKAAAMALHDPIISWIASKNTRFENIRFEKKKKNKKVLVSKKMKREIEAEKHISHKRLQNFDHKSAEQRKKEPDNNRTATTAA